MQGRLCILGCGGNLLCVAETTRVRLSCFPRLSCFVTVNLLFAFHFVHLRLTRSAPVTCSTVSNCVNCVDPTSCDVCATTSDANYFQRSCTDAGVCSCGMGDFLCLVSTRYFPSCFPFLGIELYTRGYISILLSVAESPCFVFWFVVCPLRARDLFSEISVQLTCQVSHCQTCSSNPLVCTTCSPGYRLSGNQCGACVDV